MTVRPKEIYKKLKPDTPVFFFFKKIEYKAQEVTAKRINKSPLDGSLNLWGDIHINLTEKKF